MNGNIKLKYRKKTYGYTLIELLVVIALLGIILTISTPGIRTFLNTRENIELKEFKRDIILARNSAIIENCTYNLYLFPTENRYRIDKVSGGTTIIKDVYFSNGIVMGKNNFKNSVSFYSTGAPSQGGTIILTNSKNDKIEITIEVATGKVNLYFNR